MLDQFKVNAFLVGIRSCHMLEKLKIWKSLSHLLPKSLDFYPSDRAS